MQSIIELNALVRAKATGIEKTEQEVYESLAKQKIDYFQL